MLPESFLVLPTCVWSCYLLPLHVSWSYKPHLSVLLSQALKESESIHPTVCFFITDPTEVYTWGNNTNFSLGHGNQESRQQPELVDVFARTGVYIKQVG